MKILVIGAGTVGQTLAGKLSREGHDVIVLDTVSHHLRQLEEYYDLQTVSKNALDVDTLRHVGVEEADLVIAVTDSDATNVMVCHLASKMGAKKRVARIRSAGIFDDSSIVTDESLGINQTIFPEKMASNEIHRLLLKPYAVQAFEFLGHQVEVLEIAVDPGHKLVGMTMVDLPMLSKFPFRVAAIKRGSRAFIPGPGDPIASGDHIFVTALASQIREVITNIGFNINPIEKVFIYGGTSVGMDVARSLEESSIQVVIVEPSRKRTKEMAFDLNNALVLHGEGTDANLLEGEGVSSAEVFVAVTNDENSNLLSCLLAKKLGVGKTISLVTKPDFVPLISQLNIDSVVSQRLMSINQIMLYVRRGNIVSVDELVEAQVQALEFRVTKRTLIIDCQIGSEEFQNEFPAGCLIGGLSRVASNADSGQPVRESQIVDGETVLEINDRVVVFCSEDKVPELEAFFA